MLSRHRHYGRMLLLLGLAAGIPLAWIEATSWWITAATLVPMGVMVCGYLMVGRHRLGPLCEKCIEEMPLNGTQRAEQRRWALRFVHWACDTSKNFTAAVCVFVALCYATAFLPGPWNHMGDNLSSVVLLVFLWSVQQHEKLSPWCPWCHWRDGGDEEPSPQPVPSEPSTV